jgi:hypothetical protein
MSSSMSSSSVSSSTPPSSSSGAGDTSAPSSASASETKYPLKEIRVVRNANDIPEGFEYLPDPIRSVDASGSTYFYAHLRLVCWICADFDVLG